MKCDERHHLRGPRPRAVERADGQRLAQGFGRPETGNGAQTRPDGGAEHFDGMANTAAISSESATENRGMLGAQGGNAGLSAGQHRDDRGCFGATFHTRV